MASFDCSFNRATLSDAGAYFADAAGLTTLLRHGLKPIPAAELTELRSTYCWDGIAARYLALLQR